MTKTIHQLFQEFTYECEFARKVQPETLRGYIQSFTIFSKYTPELTLQDLHPNTITNFFRILHQRKRIVGKGIIKTGIRDSTVASYRSKLSVFFTWLVDHHYIPINPLTQMSFPAPSYTDRKFLKRIDLEKIITAVHLHTEFNIMLFKRNLALFSLLLYCGLRKGELLGLQVRDVDFNRRMLTIRGETSKSGTTRLIPMHSVVVRQLKDYIDTRRHYTTPYLIVSLMRDDALTAEGLKHFIEKIKDLSGIHFHLHQFRHTFAVNFLKSSNNIFKLRELLGHKDIRMTLPYLRCIPREELRGDIEGLQLENFL
jgi:integrase/recombinase XerD